VPAEPQLKKLEARMRDTVFPRCMAVTHREHGTLELAVDVESGEISNWHAYESLAGTDAAECVERAMRGYEFAPGAEGHHFFHFGQ
jgi:hypothetical protein